MRPVVLSPVARSTIFVLAVMNTPTHPSAIADTIFSRDR